MNVAPVEVSPRTPQKLSEVAKEASAGPHREPQRLRWVAGFYFPRFIGDLRAAMENPHPWEKRPKPPWARARPGDRPRFVENRPPEGLAMGRGEPNMRSRPRHD